MRLLILGGHSFVGRHLVETALARGFEVTTFSRGRNPNRFGDRVEALRGDRRDSLTTLSGRRWDVAVDTCGYYPSAVTASTRQLRDQVGAYAFVSSLSAYPDHSRPGVDESDSAAWPATEDGGEHAWPYGRRKAECEKVVRTVFADNHLVTRLGLAVGPHDPSGRFDYWIRRLEEGGEVLAPAPFVEPLQLMDARDHAEFVLDQLVRLNYGTFNVTSPPGQLSMKQMLAACAGTASARLIVSWVEPTFLLQYHVRPWLDLPFWRGTAAETRGTMLFSTAKAEDAGLRVRALSSTARDVVSAGMSAAGQSRIPRIKERLVLRAADDEGAVLHRGLP